MSGDDAATQANARTGPESSCPMLPRDILTALAVAVVWGLSFAAIKFGVNDLPPLLLTALRFALAALPAVFFLPRPAVSWWIIGGFGFILGVVKFGAMFLAIKAGMPTGLSAVVIQTQVFFTMLMAALIFRERPTRLQLIGAALAFGGVGLVAFSKSGGAPLGPFLIILFAAFCWAAANMVAKMAGKVDMLAFSVWSSLVPPIPLLILSLIFEGPTAITQSVTHASWLAWGSLLYMSYGATLFGFSFWNHLLTRYPTASVAPFALLVPVIGLVTGALVFNEPMPLVVVTGAVFVLSGLAINVFGARLVSLLRR